MYKDHMTIKELLLEESTPLSTMELGGYSLRIGNSTINLYVLYQLLHTSVLQFCNEFTNILELNVTLPANHTIFTGDFNIHAADHLDGDTINFLDMLDSYNLRNRVIFPTHIKHHHLDLVIKDQTDTLITHITPRLFLSDHCFTHAILDIVRLWPQRQTGSYWKFRLINHEAFRTDLHTALSSVNEPDLTKLVSIYNTTITDVLDKHVPIRSKTVKQSHKQPWFTDKIRKEMILR